MPRNIILALLLLFAPVGAHAQTQELGRLYDTSWVKQSALKYGFIASFCLAQSATGFSEAYHFNGSRQTFLINSGNYHAFESVRRAGWLATGWFGYANIRDADLSRWGKARRLAGTALLARNAFEWSYRYGRYGNPFDYTEDHNQHSLVYFKFNNGGLEDAYIGTGPVTGPLVDIAFLAAGLILLK